MGIYFALDRSLSTAASLDEEKLRTSQKVGNHTEIIRRYMRGMICEDMVSLTELARQYVIFKDFS